jgi:DNA polymerase
MPLAELEAAVSGCERCGLHAGRTQTVFGTGDPQARCMIIGEAPGAEEDKRGEPFVGRAGQLLNAMLRAIGMSREAVYIANIVKCRPPKNRDPKPEEMVACSTYLHRQIALIRPRVILAVGRVAAQHLTGSTSPIGRMRGQSYAYENGDTGVPIVVTYHPAYLLRSPLEKRKSWEDLRRARDLLESRP